jgi:hypothetical protein
VQVNVSQYLNAEVVTALFDVVRFREVDDFDIPISSYDLVVTSAAADPPKFCRNGGHSDDCAETFFQRAVSRRRVGRVFAVELKSIFSHSKAAQHVGHNCAACSARRSAAVQRTAARSSTIQPHNSCLMSTPPPPVPLPPAPSVFSSPSAVPSPFRPASVSYTTWRQRCSLRLHSYLAERDSRFD